MEFDKDEMIDKLLEAKDIVIDVHNATNLSEVGNILCDIDEAVGVIEAL